MGRRIADPCDLSSLVVRDHEMSPKSDHSIF